LTAPAPGESTGWAALTWTSPFGADRAGAPAPLAKTAPRVSRPLANLQRRDHSQFIWSLRALVRSPTQLAWRSRTRSS